tara:strand:- start:1289 stop:1972 length:684 start_codon:yes stop_codon:yes gene_type:complete
MAGSVGIGGLIIGVSLLVVFSMAVQTLNYQMETSIEVLDAAANPIPNYLIEDAQHLEGAILTITVTGTGLSSGVVNGTLVANGGVGLGGFSATFTVSSGEIDTNSVVITSHGSYTTLPTSITVQGQGTLSPAPTFTFTTGNMFYSNLTNTGEGTIQTDEVWMYFDGSRPTSLFDEHREGWAQNQAVPDLASRNWYVGETIDLIWQDAPAATTRFVVAAGGFIAAEAL